MTPETLLFVGMGADSEGPHALILRALFFIGMLIVVAKLVEGVLSRLGLNSIVAYTVAGIVLGPITGLVEITEYIEIFLSIGVFIFFFLIGLDEIDIPGFMSTIRGRYFVAATVSVIHFHPGVPDSNGGFAGAGLQPGSDYRRR